MFVAKAEWMKVCPGCYRANMKKCNMCPKEFSAVEEWRKTCGACYKANQATCACGVNYFKDVEWKRSCTSCYFKNKKST